nr:MAG TPA: LARGE COMPONENT OF PYOCIN AP41, BACTERIOCIN, DNASE, PYOCIN, DNASE-IM.0A [Caudoviricetes sp.]
MDNPQGSFLYYTRITLNDYHDESAESAEGIVYSVKKYRETDGIKDLGDNFWNEGRTKEIQSRVLHI